MYGLQHGALTHTEQQALNCLKFFQNCKEMFLDRGLMLTIKLLNQEFKMVKFKSSLPEFNVLQHELVDRYGTTISKMISDMFLMPLI